MYATLYATLQYIFSGVRVPGKYFNEATKATNRSTVVVTVLYSSVHNKLISSLQRNPKQASACP